MRFLANGPDIPDELLTARDEGRVVFFCGSGVSKAGADLPDFYDLVKNVISDLGAAEDEAAYRAFMVNESIRDAGELAISFDRIFGLLEREFLNGDIEASVAKALKPSTKININAHQILIDLATHDQKLKLITTNFDRIFEACEPKAVTYTPKNIPNLANRDEINGIVYLHGRCKEDYSGAEGDGFVLSTSEFGNAYLAEGWATEFYKQIIEKYVVVFVGYTADDPPVSYLLEAMNKFSGQFKEVYAFQTGSQAEAIAKWEHKGISAIPYSSENHHAALWETLSAWALRAKDSAAWMKAVIQRSYKGPSSLLPHERGQVAHLVTTTSGAKLFAKSNPPPPSTWLCVFDKNRRLARETVNKYSNEKETFSPFLNFGLDTDEPPPIVTEQTTENDLKSIEAAWDCFVINSNDFKDNEKNIYFASIYGSDGDFAPALLPRLQEITIWISRVSHEPCAIWWASFQRGLHHSLVRQIHTHLSARKDEDSKIARQAWNYINNSNQVENDDSGLNMYRAKTDIGKNGWDQTNARQYINLLKPYISVEPINWRKSQPPIETENDLKSLLKLDVVYARKLDDVQLKIDNDWLPYTVSQLRKNLELAVELEREIGSYHVYSIVPIAETNTGDYSDTAIRGEGLPGYVVTYADSFKSLLALDSKLARTEFESWLKNGDLIFSQLRFWSVGLPDFLSEDDISTLFQNESNEAFWDQHLQRDLLTNLKIRWNDFSVGLKTLIENRFKAGPTRSEFETDAQYSRRSTHYKLNNINWLHLQGCELTFDVNKYNEEISSNAPEWKPEYANNASNSGAALFGRVHAEQNYNSLLKIPVSEIIRTADGIQRNERDILKQKDPFSGLCKDKPFRAFMALHHSAHNSEVHEWAWEKFFRSQGKVIKNKRMVLTIGKHLKKYSSEYLCRIIHSVSKWFDDVSNLLIQISPQLYDALITKLIKIFNENKSSIGSLAVREGNAVQWIREANYSPTGLIASVLISPYGILKDIKPGEGLPAKWKKFAKSLINIEGNLGIYALPILNQKVSWLYSLDPKWTEKNLLIHYNNSQDDASRATWEGFLEGERLNLVSNEIYKHLKSNIFTEFTERVQLGLKKSSYQAWSALFLKMLIRRDGSPTTKIFEDHEFRKIILIGKEKLGSSILWAIRGFLSPQDIDDEPNLKQEMIVFFEKVWPLQKSFRTSEVSVSLYSLILMCNENFSEMVRVALPFISQIKKMVHLATIGAQQDEQISKYPEQFLLILYKVLPENVAIWPYGFESVLTKIEEANPELIANAKLVELKRIWNSR